MLCVSIVCHERSSAIQHPFKLCRCFGLHCRCREEAKFSVYRQSNEEASLYAWGSRRNSEEGLACEQARSSELSSRLWNSESKSSLNRRHSRSKRHKRHGWSQRHALRGFDQPHFAVRLFGRRERARLAGASGIIKLDNQVLLRLTRKW